MTTKLEDFDTTLKEIATKVEELDMAQGCTDKVNIHTGSPGSRPDDYNVFVIDSSDDEDVPRAASHLQNQVKTEVLERQHELITPQGKSFLQFQQNKVFGSGKDSYQRVPKKSMV